MSEDERKERIAEHNRQVEAYRQNRANQLYQTYVQQIPPIPREASLETNCQVFANDPEKRRAYELATEFAKQRSVVQHEHKHFGIIFIGEFGRGKTWLATATWKQIVKDMAREACKGLTYQGEELRTQAMKPRWAKFYDFIQDVQDCYHPTSKHPVSAVLSWYQHAPLLLLDDVGDLDQGAERDDRRRRLYEVIDYRNDHGLPTILTTNLSLKALGEQFGERTVQRVFEMCAKVEMSGRNFREEPVSKQ